MNFIQIYAVSIVLCFISAMGVLYAINQYFYISIAILAFVVAIVSYFLTAQNENIKQLKERVEELEKKAAIMEP